jgi:hypothetical protein
MAESWTPIGNGSRGLSSMTVIRVDAATVLLQWATGGLFFCWFTTRRRQSSADAIGIGYGWLLRGINLVFGVAALLTGLAFDVEPVREVASIGLVLACLAALVVSVVTRKGTGFPSGLDLLAPTVGLIGLVAAGLAAGGNQVVAVVRTIVGAAFLGAITDAMLLGHWYLVQPGLPRRFLNELVQVTKLVLPLEVVALLLPTGMISVLTGDLNDGWGGTLGFFWVACAITTWVLCVVTQKALRETYYSAVMAATGLLYLAILTAFGTDIVARAVLAG